MVGARPVGTGLKPGRETELVAVRIPDGELACTWVTQLHPADRRGVTTSDPLARPALPSAADNDERRGQPCEVDGAASVAARLPSSCRRSSVGEPAMVVYA
jgi:hypothetical protein